MAVATERFGLRSRLAASAAALGNPQLAKLMVSWGIGMAADWAVLLTVSVVAFERAGALGVGLVGVVRVLPGALLGPLVSVIADRRSRPHVLAAVHGSWAVVCLALAALAPSFVPLLVVLGIGSVVTAVFKPCVNALLPQLVRGPGELVPANSAYSLVEGGATVAGPLLAGLLIGLGGPGASFAGIALALATAAVTSARIRTEFQPARAIGPDRARPPQRLRGATALVGTPGVRVLFWVFMAQLTMRGLLNVFVVAVALTAADGGEGKAGVLFAATGVGGLVGALGVLGLGGTGMRGGRWFAAGAVLWGLPVLVIGVWPVPAVAIGALLVLGFGNALLDVSGFSLLNRLLPDHVAGRAYGVFWGAAAGAIALGSAIAPALITAIGLPAAMMVTGGALAALPVAAWPALRQLDAAATADPADVAVLRRVPLFTPMPVLGVESLARAARVRSVEPGQVVVAQGDRGDLFYAVAEGSLRVTEDGHERRLLGPGDGFGEIALLVTTTRTATVTALSSCRLLCLDREAFVAAVTGHRGAERLAGDTIARLWRGSGDGSVRAG